MFARTKRLLLRPGFPEDAAELAAAIGDLRIARNLVRVPWPYGLPEAESFLASPGDPLLPSLLIAERTSSDPLVIGGCGLRRRTSGAVQLGYWVARPHWGRGIATEAATAIIDIARTLGFSTIEASHFLDNPASGRVLEKLGFEASGIVAPLHCVARGEQVPARLYRLSLKPAAQPCLCAEEVLAA
jgi:RimJ/RimL family protein N-acetyltransferase